ncbi:hypothetical protein DPMN_027218 [Dreissena polymorpha]|uniref:Uncharacterized protein n=1 Tax=Dreissena polymorpha TaxID=45954 RepID=A0A9D4LSG6_DREPO|nr:hypothetical protein DPMN_027218 [Dreissena polymorpha]
MSVNLLTKHVNKSIQNLTLSSFHDHLSPYDNKNDPQYAVDKTVINLKLRRGKHTPHNKTPDAIIEDVRNHIESFPTVEAHYTRQDTKRQYDQYFKDIPSDKTTRDSLTEPDTMEESEDSNVE